MRTRSSPRKSTSGAARPFFSRSAAPTGTPFFRLAPSVASPTLQPKAAEQDLKAHEEEALNEPGHPLDTAALNDFQTSFGHDFSSVRVHTDERAAASTASLSARAYTIGRHIVFGRGEYAPGTTTGRHLLGH